MRASTFSPFPNVGQTWTIVCQRLFYANVVPPISPGPVAPQFFSCWLPLPFPNVMARHLLACSISYQSHHIIHILKRNSATLINGDERHQYNLWYITQNINIFFMKAILPFLVSYFEFVLNCFQCTALRQKVSSLFKTMLRYRSTL